MLSKILKLKRSDVDDWWTGFVISIPGIAGSLVSVLYFGAGLWAVVSIAFGRYPLSLPKRARLFVCAGLGYALALLVSSIANDGAAGILPGLAAGMAFYFVPLLISRFVSSTPQRALDTMCAYAPVGAVLCLIPALLQAFVLQRAVEGGTGNGSVFGFVSAILAAISLANAGSSISKLRVLAYAGFISGAGALLLSQSRALYPVIIFVPLLFLFFSAQVSRLVVKRALGAIVLATALAGFLFWSQLSSDVFTSADELAQIGGEPFSSSLGMRIELWKAALTAFGDAPWLGYGQLHKMTAVIAQVPDFMSYVKFTHAHNVWIDSLLAGGLPAAALVSLVLASPLCALANDKGQRIDTRVRYLVVAISLIAVLNSLLNTLFTHDILVVVFLIPIIVVLAQDE